MKRGMILLLSYKPLWETMADKGITTYSLIVHHGINPRTINNLKHNRSITMLTLEQLCRILDCTPNDIVVFIDEAE